MGGFARGRKQHGSQLALDQMCASISPRYTGDGSHEGPIDPSMGGRSTAERGQLRPGSAPYGEPLPAASPRADRDAAFGTAPAGIRHQSAAVDMLPSASATARWPRADRSGGSGSAAGSSGSSPSSAGHTSLLVGSLGGRGRHQHGSTAALVRPAYVCAIMGYTVGLGASSARRRFL